MFHSLFSNSDVLFVEYFDILKTPELTLLPLCIKNPKLREVINFSPIDILIGEDNGYFDAAGLIEWYTFRKTRNIFKELHGNIFLSDEALDELLFSQLTSNERIIGNSPLMDFANKIRILLKQGMVKTVLVYTPIYNQIIEKDISFNFGDDRVKYVHGVFADVVFKIPESPTFVLSDIEKVIVLEDMSKLELSTILMADDFRYNRVDMEKYKIDFVDMNKKCIFKYGFFKAMI